MATTPITDNGDRVFICGATTASVSPGGPIDVQTGGRSFRVNIDEVNDLIAALQHAQTYSTTAPAVPVVVG